MNTNEELDRIVSSWLEDRVVEPPHGSLESALDRAAETPQQRHRWLGRWLGRGHGATRSADDRGIPPHTNPRRNRLMFSVTAVTAGLGALALMATLAFPRGAAGPEHAPAAGGATISVAADGSGDYSTISEAVAAAGDGDTVLVEPGTYREALYIDKDITLAGNGGSPAAVVIRVPADAPVPDPALAPVYRLEHGPQGPLLVPTGIQLVETDATISNLQVVGLDDGIALLASGGAPTLDKVYLKHESDLGDRDVLAGGLFIDRGSRATVRDSVLWHRVHVDGGSEPIFEGDSFDCAMISISGGSAPEYRRNTIQGCVGPSFLVSGGAAPLIEGNTLTDGGIKVTGVDGDGTSAVIRDNTIASQGGDGILVKDDATATIERNRIRNSRDGVSISHTSVDIRGNEFTSNQRAVTLSGSSSVVDGNTIEGGDTGITLVYSGAPVISSNSVEGAAFSGIFVGAGTQPTVTGNRICGNAVNLLVEPAARATLDGNDVCPDGVAMTGG